MMALEAGQSNEEDLISAATSGNLDEVKRLIKTGVDVNHLDEAGKPALYHAFVNGHIELYDFLLSQGVNIALAIGAISKNVKDEIAKAEKKSEKILKAPNLNPIEIGEIALAIQNPNCSIEYLDLCRCNMGDKGAIKLARAFMSPYCIVGSANLGSNKIGLQGAIALAEAFTHSKLGYVYLYNNEIGDEGATALISAIQSSKFGLWGFNINYNKIKESKVNLLKLAILENKSLVNVHGHNLEKLNLSTNVENLEILAKAGEADANYRLAMYYATLANDSPSKAGLSTQEKARLKEIAIDHLCRAANEGHVLALQTAINLYGAGEARVAGRGTLGARKNEKLCSKYKQILAKQMAEITANQTQEVYLQEIETRQALYAAASKVKETQLQEKLTANNKEPDPNSADVTSVTSPSKPPQRQQQAAAEPKSQETGRSTSKTLEPPKQETRQQQTKQRATKPDKMNPLQQAESPENTMNMSKDARFSFMQREVTKSTTDQRNRCCSVM